MNTVEEKTISYEIKSIDYHNFKDTPEKYQSYVIRILSMQAYAEKLGAEEMGYQLRLAPDYHARKGLARIVSEEADHAYRLYNILEKIGVTEEQAIAIAESKSDHSKATQSMEGVISVGDEQNQWLDLVLNNMLMDRAGSFMVNNFSQSSFAPWAEACEKIYRDEQWHKAFGLKEFKSYLTLHASQKDLPLKFSTWFSYAMNFFGPPSVNTYAELKEFGIKRLSNQALREEFISEVKALLKINSWEYLLLPIVYEYPCKIKENV